MEISYKGTNYSGWQNQKGVETVQGAVEHALATLLKLKVPIMGSGRTDAGVHGTHQIAHFNVEAQLDIAALQYKLNAFLSRDISINWIRPVRDNVNARFEANSRLYHYYIHQRKNPFKNELSYYFKYPINVGLINQACELIKGWQNFECFSKVHTEVNHFNCDIFEAKWSEENGIHLFEIKANRFLRGMVRAIVGTLLDVGEGKTSLKEFQKILESNDRSMAGRAVPATGLYLMKVEYPSDIYID